MFENFLVYGDCFDLREDPEILNQESRSQAQNFAFFFQTAIHKDSYVFTYNICWHIWLVEWHKNNGHKQFSVNQLLQESSPHNPNSSLINSFHLSQTADSPESV
jgi:hypothetical protein